MERVCNGYGIGMQWVWNGDGMAMSWACYCLSWVWKGLYYICDLNEN